MRYLGLALYSEGPTDDRFLGPLLHRLCQQLCHEHATQLIDISNVLSLIDAGPDREKPREERIEHAALSARGAWNILFVHGDGAADPVRAIQNCVAPGLLKVHENPLFQGSAGVAVVPVRETEAWVLADGDALRAVFGTRLTDAELGIPSNPPRVEKLTDPKSVLENAFKATNPSKRRARAGAAALMDALGDRVAIEKLRLVPSFQKLDLELLHALRQIQVCP